MSAVVFMKYALFAWMMPYILGAKLTRHIGGEENRPFHSVLYGYLLMWAVLQCVTVPMIFLRRGFQEVVGICLVIFGTLAVWTIVTDFRWILGIWKDYPHLWKRQGVVQSVLIILIVMVAAYVSLCYLVNDDDAYYVVTAQTTLDTGTMYTIDPYTGEALGSLPSRYVLSPFPVFVSFMSCLIGVKAPAMAHTLMPFGLVIMSFFVYYMWAKELYKNERTGQNYFLLFSILSLMLSNFSTHARGMMLFSRIWQGKAILATILLPLLLFMGVKMVTETFKRLDWFLLFIVMMASCFVSSMGIMLAAIEIGILAIVAALYHRRWTEIKWTIVCCLPNLVYAGIYVIIR